MHALENYSTSVWKALQMQQIESKAIVANQATQTVYQPMSVVVIEQYYPEWQRLVQDELVFQFLPLGLEPNL
jgi:hypothetical protein